MAIIKCPECGKDVSDTAPSCIHCGFSLTEHFNKLQAQNDLRNELNEKLDDIAKMDIPNKPACLDDGREAFLTFSLLCLGVGLFALTLSFCLGSLVALFFITGSFFILLSFLFLRAMIISYKKDMEEYSSKISGWDEYKESETKRIISEYNIYFDNVEKYGCRYGKPKESSPQNEHTIKCPACGSTKVKKISAAKKVISTELLGLASSDIGKQMVCDKCGYKF